MAHDDMTRLRDHLPTDIPSGSSQSLPSEGISRPSDPVHCCPKGRVPRLSNRIPKLPEEQVRLQKDYIRVVLLMADIDRTGRFFSDAVRCNRWDDALQELKNGFIAYALLGQSRANICRYGKNCGTVAQLARGLAQRLDFLGHLRNLISGHLDDRLLEKVIQWEPQIFCKGILGNPKSDILVFKSLLEAGIDCCIAEYPQDKKLFSGEIDLAYPPDLKEFMEFMHETFRLSVKFLSAVKEIIFQKLNWVADKITHDMLYYST